MSDIVDTLKKIGATKDKVLLAIKNANSPAGPGRAAGPLGKDASGNPVRYSKTGEPPTPVTVIDSNIKKLR